MSECLYPVSVESNSFHFEPLMQKSMAVEALLSLMFLLGLIDSNAYFTKYYSAFPIVLIIISMLIWTGPIRRVTAINVIWSYFVIIGRIGGKIENITP